MDMFPTLKNGFAQVLADRAWLPKILLGGFLLINPFLIVFGLMLASGRFDGTPWLGTALLGTLAFNVLSFWFPLGFTYEVLRRAVTGSAPQLPDWSAKCLPRYAYEGAVKLILALFTLILPVALWMGAWFFAIDALALPNQILSMVHAPIFLFTIPFCGVACCRWLDGDSVLNCALNYPKNFAILMKRPREFFLASLFLTGFNAVACAFVITIPFAAVFGLCLVDTWFGPIYADATGRRAAQRPPKTAVQPELIAP